MNADEKISYTLHVNGQEHQVTDAWYADDLLHVLRFHLGLTGTKYGCEHGQCGACTVHVDGEAICACLELAANAVGSKIVTIEGYNRADGGLTSLQQALVDHGALQCGYCTPGIIMSARRASSPGTPCHRGGDPRGHGRQSVSLHGLWPHRRGDCRGGKGAT